MRSSRTSRAFATVVDELIEFFGDANLIAHNASFDLAFVNAELARIGRPALGDERVIDTMMLARRKHPGSPASLDALMSRYQIDSSRRTLHGALLDAELLAEVYIELIGGRQAALVLGGEPEAPTITIAHSGMAIGPRLTPRSIQRKRRGTCRPRRGSDCAGIEGNLARIRHRLMEPCSSWCVFLHRIKSQESAMNLEQEILELENQFWQSMIDKDPKAGVRLTADPCIVTGAQGVSRIDSKTFAKMVEHGGWILHDYEFSDVKVERVTDDVAVIAYKVRENLTVDGKKLTMEAADASTWVRGRCRLEVRAAHRIRAGRPLRPRSEAAGERRGLRSTGAQRLGETRGADGGDWAAFSRAAVRPPLRCSRPSARCARS